MEREALYERVDARVDAMVAAGAGDEVRRADAAGASATARQALGFEELLDGDVEAMKRRTRRYAKRQLTWMRKLAGVHEVDVTGRDARRRGRRDRAAPDRSHLSRARQRPPHRGRHHARAPEPVFKGDAVREVERARQRLRDRRGRRPALGADPGPRAAPVRPPRRRRLGRRAGAGAARRATGSSPGCGSSTPTARRPSCRATARARRSCTCAVAAGWSPTRSRSRPRRARSGPTITGPTTCRMDMGRASLRSPTYPDGGAGRQGRAERRRAPVALPARVDRQPPVRDRGRRGRDRGPRPARHRPGDREPRARSRTARTCRGSRR